MPGVRRLRSEPYSRSSVAPLPRAMQCLRHATGIPALGSLYRLPSPYLERRGIGRSNAGSLAPSRAGRPLQRLQTLRSGLCGLAARLGYSALPHLPGAALLHRLDRGLPGAAVVGGDARSPGKAMNARRCANLDVAKGALHSSSRNIGQVHDLPNRHSVIT